MEHPVKEVPEVIRLLCSTPPSVQQKAVLKYFLPDASFRHIICRVPHIKTFELPWFGEVNSRYLIGCVYLWYKSLSPTIRVDIHSVAFDQKTLLLYISMHQRFSLWILPGYSAYIPLTTVIHLQKDETLNRYLISSQEDFYQPEEFLKFFWPGGHYIGEFLQLMSAVISVLCALFLVPVVRVLQMLVGFEMD